MGIFEMKKYKIGYTQGAFDMFHIGHLNLLRNAYDQCETLIVGVNSDALVSRYKSKRTIIPEQERLEIIRAIKYVDHAMLVETLDKSEIREQVKFDAVFIGSDWKGSPRWEQTEKDLMQFGVDVVYLAYTQGTNSTLLREKLDGM